MTTKNLYTIMFDSELPGSPEQVIGAFKDGKTTYAKIFECLCVYVKSNSAVNMQDLSSDVFQVYCHNNCQEVPKQDCFYSRLIVAGLPSIQH